MVTDKSNRADDDRESCMHARTMISQLDALHNAVRAFGVEVVEALGVERILGVVSRWLEGRTR